MNRFGMAASGVFAIAPVLGCATLSADAGFGDVQALLAERGLDRVHWNQGGPADAEAAAAVRDLLQDDLTVDAAVQIALLNNRNLQATCQELGIAEADLVEAGLLANPIFHGEIRFPARPRYPIELDVTQDFLSILFLPMRKKVAAAEFESAKLRVASAVLDLAARTRTAFYTMQGAEQMLEMRRSVADALEASCDAAVRLREAGNITDLELANERAQLGRGRVELVLAEEEALEARETLTVVMGVWGEETQFTLAGRLPDLPALEIEPEGLETLAVSQRLDLAAARTEVETVARFLGLQDYAVLWPETAITGHLEREPDGVTTIGPSLEIPLPIFNQGQTARARGRAMLQQAEDRYVALAVEIRSEARRLWKRMISARERAEYYRTVLLPLQGEIVEETQLQYNGMLVGVFQLLQAKQSEIDAARAWIEAQRDYWIARTELERAVGGRLPAGESPAEATEPPAESEVKKPEMKPEHPEHDHDGDQP